jgi:hypothetical protein
LENLETKTLHSKNKLKIPTDVIKLKLQSKGNNVPLALIWHYTIKMYRGGVLTLALDCAKLLVSYPGKFNVWFHWIRDLMVPRTEQPHFFKYIFKKKGGISVPARNK